MGFGQAVGCREQHCFFGLRRHQLYSLNSIVRETGIVCLDDRNVQWILCLVLSLGSDGKRCQTNKDTELCRYCIASIHLLLFLEFVERVHDPFEFFLVVEGDTYFAFAFAVAG